MSACSSCKQRIIWAKTASGKAIPLNPDPQPGGNLELKDGVARVVQPHPAVKLYVSHFATCAQADAHRKGRRP
jgi:hypothetical protein